MNGGILLGAFANGTDLWAALEDQDSYSWWMAIYTKYLSYRASAKFLMPHTRSISMLFLLDSAFYGPKQMHPVLTATPTRNYLMATLNAPLRVLTEICNLERGRFPLQAQGNELPSSQTNHVGKFGV